MVAKWTRYSQHPFSAGQFPEHKSDLVLVLMCVIPYIYIILSPFRQLLRENEMSYLKKKEKKEVILDVLRKKLKLKSFLLQPYFTRLCMILVDAAMNTGQWIIQNTLTCRIWVCLVYFH